MCAREKADFTLRKSSETRVFSIFVVFLKSSKLFPLFALQINFRISR